MPAHRKQPTGRRWVTRAALLLLVGYLLFAHGCHGDEDTELFARSASRGSLTINHESTKGRKHDPGMVVFSSFRAFVIRPRSAALPSA
jgi:hypothetical protein